MFRVIHVPKVEELGVKKMWNTAMLIPGFAKYMPQEWIESEGKKADRSYFWDIMNTMQPEYVKAVIMDVTEQR